MHTYDDTSMIPIIRNYFFRLQNLVHFHNDNFSPALPESLYGIQVALRYFTAKEATTDISLLRFDKENDIWVPVAKGEFISERFSTHVSYRGWKVNVAEMNRPLELLYHAAYFWLLQTEPGELTRSEILAALEEYYATWKRVVGCTRAVPDGNLFDSLPTNRRLCKITNDDHGLTVLEYGFQHYKNNAPLFSSIRVFKTEQITDDGTIVENAITVTNTRPAVFSPMSLDEAYRLFNETRTGIKQR